MWADTSMAIVIHYFHNQIQLNVPAISLLIFIIPTLIQTIHVSLIMVLLWKTYSNSFKPPPTRKYRKINFLARISSLNPYIQVS